MKCRVHVDGNNQIPAFWRKGLYRFNSLNARIIDNDVDAAKVPRGEIGKLGGAFGKAQIERYRSGGSACVLNLFYDGFESSDGASA